MTKKLEGKTAVITGGTDVETRQQAILQGTWLACWMLERI